MDFLSIFLLSLSLCPTVPSVAGALAVRLSASGPWPGQWTCRPAHAHPTKGHTSLLLVLVLCYYYYYRCRTCGNNEVIVHK